MEANRVVSMRLQRSEFPPMFLQRQASGWAATQVGGWWLEVVGGQQKGAGIHAPALPPCHPPGTPSPPAPLPPLPLPTCSRQRTHGQVINVSSTFIAQRARIITGANSSLDYGGPPASPCICAFIIILVLPAAHSASGISEQGASGSIMGFPPPPLDATSSSDFCAPCAHTGLRQAMLLG